MTRRNMRRRQRDHLRHIPRRRHRQRIPNRRALRYRDTNVHIPAQLACVDEPVVVRVFRNADRQILVLRQVQLRAVSARLRAVPRRIHNHRTHRHRRAIRRCRKVRRHVAVRLVRRRDRNLVRHTARRHFNHVANTHQRTVERNLHVNIALQLRTIDPLVVVRVFRDLNHRRRPIVRNARINRHRHRLLGRVPRRIRLLHQHIHRTTVRQRLNRRHAPRPIRLNRRRQLLAGRRHRHLNFRARLARTTDRRRRIVRQAITLRATVRIRVQLRRQIRGNRVYLRAVAAQRTHVTRHILHLGRYRQRLTFARALHPRHRDVVRKNVRRRQHDRRQGNAIHRHQQAVPCLRRRRQRNRHPDVTIEFRITDEAVVVRVFRNRHHRRARLAQNQLGRVFHRSRTVACRILDRGRRFKRRPARRRIERHIHVARRNLLRRQRDHLRHVPRARHRQRVAHGRTLRHRHAHINLAVQFACVDETVVVRVFRNADRQVLIRRRINLRAVAADRPQVLRHILDLRRHRQRLAFARAHHPSDRHVACSNVRRRQHDRRTIHAIHRHQQAVARLRRPRQTHIHANVTRQFACVEPSVVVRVFGNAHHRRTLVRRRNHRLVARHRRFVAGRILHLGRHHQFRAIARCNQFQHNLPGINLGLRQHNPLVRVPRRLHRQQVARNRTRRQTHFNTHRPLQFGLVDEAVVVRVFRDLHHRRAKHRQVQLRAVRPRAALVARRIHNLRRDIHHRATGLRCKFRRHVAVRLVCRRDRDLVRHTTRGDFHHVAHRDLRPVKRHLHPSVTNRFRLVDEAVVVRVFRDLNHRRIATVRHARINRHRHRLLGRIPRGIRFLHRDIHRTTVRQRLRRRHAPRAIRLHRRRQLLARARHRHFNLRARLARPADRRRRIVRQAIALRATVRSRVQLCRQVRRLRVHRHRHRRRRRVPRRIRFLHRNVRLAFRQISHRRHAPRAVRLNRRRQLLAGRRHRHFNFRTRLARTTDRRRLVRGDPVSLRPAVRRRIKLRRQIRGNRVQLRAVAHFRRLVTRRVRHLRRHHQRRTRGRCRQFNHNLPRINLRLRQNNALIRIPGGLQRQQVARNRRRRQRHFNTDRPLQFGLVDEPVVVRVFRNLDRNPVQRTQVQLRAISTRPALVPRSIHNHRRHHLRHAFRRRRKARRHVTIRQITRRHRNVLRHAARRHLHHVSQRNLRRIKRHLHINLTNQLSLVNKTIIVRVFRNINLRRCPGIGYRGIDHHRHRYGAAVTGRVGFLDRNIGFTLGQIGLGRHTPRAIGAHRRRQLFAGRRHRHFDLRARLTRTTDRRRLVGGNAIPLRAAIGCRVQYGFQGWRGGINGNGYRHRRRVACIIGCFDGDICLAIRELNRRCDSPLSIGSDGRSQDFTRRHRHRNLGTRLAGATDRRCFVIGQPIALQAAIGCRIQKRTHRRRREVGQNGRVTLELRRPGRGKSKLIGLRIDRLDHTQEFDKGVPLVPSRGRTSGRCFLFKQLIQIAATVKCLGNFLETLFVIGHGTVRGIGFYRRTHFDINPCDITRTYRHLAPICQLENDLPAIRREHGLTFSDDITELETAHLTGSIPGECFTRQGCDFGDNLGLGHDGTPETISNTAKSRGPQMG